MVVKNLLTPLRYLAVFHSIQLGFILLPAALVEGEQAAQYVWFVEYILLSSSTYVSLLALWYRNVSIGVDRVFRLRVRAAVVAFYGNFAALFLKHVLKAETSLSTD